MANGKRPGSAGYWIGALLIILSFGAGIGGPVFGVATLISGFSKYTSFDEGATQINFSPDTYWVLTSSASDEVTITDANGKDIAVKTPTWDSSVTYDSGGDTYSGLGEFTISQSGIYTVDVQVSGFNSSRSGRSDAALIGSALSDEVTGLVMWSAIGIGAAVLLFIIGLVLLIVTGVRRSKWKKQNQPPMGGPMMGGGYGGGYQPPPGPGGYPSQPPAPGGYQPPPAPGGYQPPPAPGYQPPAAPPPAPPGGPQGF